MVQGAKILLIDDDIEIGPLVRGAVLPYTVEQVGTGAAAMELLGREDFDLCLIDVNLPDRDGFGLASEISRNARWSHMPLIILSERGNRPDVVYGLNSGADDYIPKPFDSQELLSRINARLRRRRESTGRLFTAGPFELNRDFQACSILAEDGKRDAGLTSAEFRIFFHLLQNPNLVFQRKDLVKVLAQSESRVLETRGINTHIARIRKKLGPFGSRIVTVRGKGYSYQP